MPTPRRRGPFVPSACLWVGVALVAVGALVIAGTERKIAHERLIVTVIANVRSPTERDAARAFLDRNDDIAEIYGVPVGSPVELVADASDPAFLTPAEAPTRRLLPRERLLEFAKPAGLRLKGYAIAGTMLAVGVLLLVIARATRGRRRTPNPVVH